MKDSEKTLLIEESAKYIKTDSFSFILAKNIVITVVFSFFLLIPKIYIASSIYYSSIQINKRLNEFYSLKAENSILKMKIEKLKFKNRLNTSSF